MEHTPYISVIVPVYKVADRLPACLESLRAQTFSDFECILVDDGSPDECGAICDEVAAADSRFSVIHKQNAGLSAARNAGLDIARGEYVVFLDADDELAPRALEYAARVQAALLRWGVRIAAALNLNAFLPCHDGELRVFEHEGGDGLPFFGQDVGGGHGINFPGKVEAPVGHRGFIQLYRPLGSDGHQQQFPSERPSEASCDFKALLGG